MKSDTPASTAAVFETYSSWEPTETEVDGKTEKADSELVFPVKSSETQYVWIKAVDEGVILAKKGTAVQPGERVKDLFTGADGDGTAVWKVPVTGNISATAYEALVTINTSNIATQITAELEKMTGYTKDGKVTLKISETGNEVVKLARAIEGVSVKFTPGKDIGEATITPSVKVNSAGTGLELSIISDKDIARNAKDGATAGADKDLGDIVLTLGDYATISIDVTLKGEQ